MKKILYPFIALICLVVALFILGSTPFVLNIAREKAQSALQKGTNLPITIGSLRGNLFYALEIRDVNVDSIVILKKSTVTYDVFKLLFRTLQIRNLSLEGLYVDINGIEKLSTTSEQKNQEESRFSIHIERLSVKNGNLFGMVNGTPLHAAILLNGRVTPHHAVIDTLTIQTEQSTLSGHGTIPLTDTGSLDMAYSLDLLLDEIPVQHLSGKLQSTGLLTGSTEDPRIESQMAFAAQYKETKFIGTATMHWQTPLLDSLVVNAKITATVPSLSLNIEKKDTWHASISKQDRKFRGTLHSSYGQLTIDGSGEGAIDNPVITAHIDGRLTYKQLASIMRATVTYRDQVLTLTKFNLQDQVITVKAHASLSTEESQNITAHMTAECNDIALLAPFIGTTKPLSGKASMTARVTGTITNPDIDAAVTINDATIYNETITTADFALAFQDSTLSVFKGKIQSSRGELTVIGKYHLTDSTFTVHLLSDSLRLTSPEVWGTDTIPVSGKIGLDAQINGTVNSPRGSGTIHFADFAYDTMHFDNHELIFSLQNQTLDIIFANEKHSVNIIGRMRTSTPYESKALITMEDFAMERFVRADTALLTGTVLLQGFMNDLEAIKGKASVSRLLYVREGYRMENVDTLVIKLENNNLQLDAFELVVQGQVMNIQGYIPLDFQHGSFDVACSAQHFDVAPLMALVPDAPEISGLLSLTATVTGTLREPEVNGELYVTDVAFVTPVLVLDSINGNISFKRDAIAIDHLTGRVNKGTFSTRGLVHLKKEKLDLMFLQTTVERMEYTNNEYGRYVISGELETSARHDSILLTGDIIVDNAVYDIPFNVQTIITLLTSVNRPPPEQAKILKRIHCDVGITAPHGVLIKNNIADVTADVDLQVRGFLSRINVYGRITTQRTGTIKYLGKKFDIVNATIEFDNPYTIDPVLNLEATTFVSSIDGDYDITLLLSGTIENWRLELSSNPPVPEHDIISLVLIGKRRPTTVIAGEGEGFNLKGTAHDYALDLARGDIERTAEKTLGLDKVTISGDLLAPRELSIGIEKKLSRRLTLVYGSGIESWELHRIGFNYDITDNLSIFTLHDQENLNSSVDLDIHFDLK